MSIAGFTCLQARRTRIPYVALGVIVACALAAEFSAGLAITESASYRTAVYGALARLGCVLVVVLFVAASVARELEGRMLDLTLSRPVSRASWYLGRLLGFTAIAALLAVLASVPAWLWSEPLRVLAWTGSLAAELALLAAVALTGAITLRQVTLAVTVTLAFYVLARAIDAIVLMSRGPSVDPESWLTQGVAAAVALIAMLLPALDRLTASAWLGAGSELPALLPLAAEIVLFALLAIAVGLFDLYRLDD